MSLALYFAQMSTASITALVLEELGVRCERVDLDLRAGDTRKAEFLALNPNGKVPVLVHDGTAIWESAAITLYLGETFGVERNLYPPPGPKRGEAMRWVVWTNVTLGAAVAKWTGHALGWLPEEQRNAKYGDVAAEDIGKLLAILDDALEGRDYLLGDYTLVDTHLGSYLTGVQHLQFDFEPFPRVRNWLSRCSSRPASARLLAKLRG